MSKFKKIASGYTKIILEKNGYEQKRDIFFVKSISSEMLFGILYEEGVGGFKNHFTMVFTLDPRDVPQDEIANATFTYLDEVHTSKKNRQFIKSISGLDYGWFNFTTEKDIEKLLKQVTDFALQNIVEHFEDINTRELFEKRIMTGKHPFIKINGDATLVDFFHGHFALNRGDKEKANKHFNLILSNQLEKKRNSFIYKESEIALNKIL